MNARQMTSSSAEPELLLTMDEFASRFGCTVRTVQNWIKEGELTPIRRGRLVRFRESQLYAMGGGVR